MMEMNIWAILIATAVPMILGMIWYNPKIGFGRAWMNATGMTEEKARESNMVLVFSLTILFAFIIAFGMQSLVIHQYHVGSLLMTQADFADPNGASAGMFHTIMEHYGSSYRTFQHGLFHGMLAGFLIALPVLAVNALFEAKGAKYIAINAGYWILSMGLMGGVISAFS